MADPAPGGLPTPQAPEGDDAPMGSSPASSPTPNDGMEAQGMQGTALILDAATELLAKVGVTSPIGKLLLDFIKKGSQLVQPGAVSPAAKDNQLQNMQRNNAQNGQQMAAIRQSMSQSQQPPGQPGQAA